MAGKQMPSGKASRDMFPAHTPSAILLGQTACRCQTKRAKRATVGAPRRRRCRVIRAGLSAPYRLAGLARPLHSPWLGLVLTLSALLA